MVDGNSMLVIDEQSSKALLEMTCSPSLSTTSFKLLQSSNAASSTSVTVVGHYFSRSRNAIWHKGKTSGFTQKVTEIRIDDDQDSIWLTVDIGDGASCHVGYRSCFYRSIPMGPIENGRKVEMKFLEDEKKFDPEEVYKGQPNPTKI